MITPNVTSDKPAAKSPTAVKLTDQIKDIIPVWLLVLIFALVIVLVYKLMEPSWKMDWNRYQSLKAQRTGQFAKAVGPLKWLNAEKPGNPTYLSELGHAYLNLKDWDNAIKYLQEAQTNKANVSPDEQGNCEIAEFHTYIGRAYYGKEDLVEAEKHLLQGLKINKLDGFANFILGEIEMKKGNYVKAADYFKVVARDPLFKERVKVHYADIEKKLFAGIE